MLNVLNVEHMFTDKRISFVLCQSRLWFMALLRLSQRWVSVRLRSKFQGQKKSETVTQLPHHHGLDLKPRLSVQTFNTGHTDAA